MVGIWRVSPGGVRGYIVVLSCTYGTLLRWLWIGDAKNCGRRWRICSCHGFVAFAEPVWGDTNVIFV